MRLLLLLQDNQDNPWFVEHARHLVQLAFTLAWLLLILLMRSFGLRILQGKEWPSEEERLRWRLRTVNAAVILLIIGVILIWFTELRDMALGAVALAAALVIATREFIVCITGSALRTVSNSYSIGDRIELAGHRGDVIEYGLLTTTIMEVGPSHRRTGRAVVIPHSVLLTQAVVNESFTEEYVLHTFELPLRDDEDWQEAERVLLRTARKVCEADLPEAERHMRRLAREHGLVPSTVEPRVSIKLSDKSTVHLVVRVPTAARNRGRTEQTILRAFLEHMRPPPTGAEQGPAPEEHG
jgi:small-conductance mechanosensitive channel